MRRGYSSSGRSVHDLRQPGGRPAPGAPAPLPGGRRGPRQIVRWRPWRRPVPKPSITSPDPRVVLERISGILVKLYGVQGAATWLQASHEAFGGRAARDLINEGRGREVLSYLVDITDGAYL